MYIKLAFVFVKESFHNSLILYYVLSCKSVLRGWHAFVYLFNLVFDQEQNGFVHIIFEVLYIYESNNGSSMLVHLAVLLAVCYDD